MPPSDLSLEAYARKLESMSTEPTPPEMRVVLHRLFEGQQFVEGAVGKLMAEVSLVSADVRLLKLTVDKLETVVQKNTEAVRDIKLKLRNSQRKLDDIDGELENTKDIELKSLRADRKRLAWIIVGTLVAGIVGFMLRQLLPR